MKVLSWVAGRVLDEAQTFGNFCAEINRRSDRSLGAKRIFDQVDPHSPDHPSTGKR